MKTILFVVSVLAGLTLTNGDATADFATDEMYSYVLENYPTDAEGCATKASELAQLIASDGQRQVIAAECRKKAEGFDVALSYTANEELEVVSTIPGYPQYLRTGYGELADCLADLDKEQQTFIRETALLPIASYCFRRFESGASPYLLRIDGLGSSSRPPRAEELMLSGYLVDTPAEVRRKFENGPGILGAMLSRAIFQPDVGGRTLQIFYYGPKEIGFTQTLVAEFDDVNDCAATAENLGSLWPSPASPSLGAFCTTWNKQFKLTATQVESMAQVISEAAPGTYASDSECKSDADRVLNIYRQHLKRHVINGLCTVIDKKSRLYVYYLRSAGI